MDAKAAKKKALANKKAIEAENKRLAPQRAKEAAETERKTKAESKAKLQRAIEHLDEILEPAVAYAVELGELSIVDHISTSDVWCEDRDRFATLNEYVRVMKKDGFTVTYKQTLEEDYEGPGSYEIKISWE